MRTVLLVALAGLAGAAFPQEKLEETAARWFAPRQTVREAAKLVGKWTGNFELLERELDKTGWASPFDRPSFITDLFGARPDDRPAAFFAFASEERSKDSTQIAFLYPATDLRFGEIVLKYDTHRDTNGVIRVSLGNGRKEVYVLSSADGQWAAISPRPELTISGMARLPFVLQRRREGTLSELYTSSSLMARAVKKLAEISEGNPTLARTRKVVLEKLSRLGGMSISVAVTERGVDLLTVAEDGNTPEWKPLVMNRWNDVPDDAVSALVRTDGFKTRAYRDFFGSALTVFKECGLPLEDFCTYKAERGIVRRTFDADGAIEHFRTRTNELAAAVMENGLIRKTVALWRAQTTPGEGETVVENTFAIKGYRTQAPIAERFWTTLPEAKEMQLSSMQFLSPYSIIRAFVGASHNADALKRLPDEAVCGIAGARGAEGAKSVERWRISAEEIMRLAAAWRVMKSVEFFN